jgi:hypothetical protein
MGKPEQQPLAIYFLKMPRPPPRFAGDVLAWSVHSLKKRTSAQYFGLCFFATCLYFSDVPPGRKKHSRNRFRFKLLFLRKSMFNG